MAENIEWPWYVLRTAPSGKQVIFGFLSKSPNARETRTPPSIALCLASGPWGSLLPLFLAIFCLLVLIWCRFWKCCLVTLAFDFNGIRWWLRELSTSTDVWKRWLAEMIEEEMEFCTRIYLQHRNKAWALRSPILDFILSLHVNKYYTGARVCY